MTKSIPFQCVQTPTGVVLPEVFTGEKNWIDHFDSVAAVKNWDEEAKLKLQSSMIGHHVSDARVASTEEHC